MQYRKRWYETPKRLKGPGALMINVPKVEDTNMIER